MKRLILIGVVILLVVSVFYFGGRGGILKSKYAIKINDFSMTKDEFGEYFKEVNVSGEDTAQEREKVLDTLVNRKVILYEGEKEGVHQDKEFLKELEMYYEQLLFKRVIDKKSKEMASKVTVSSEEVMEMYNRMFESGLIEKSLNEVYDQIKQQILKEKQTKALSAWVEEARQKAKVKIDRPSELGVRPRNRK